jgi:hypothetical protein
MPALETVATAGDHDTQFTCPVRIWVELSENVPVTINCWVAPTAILGLTGVTASDVSFGPGIVLGVTVSSIEPVTPSRLAMMEEVPAARA